MLYISRRLGREKWGVVDTDDGVEEVCTRNELLNVVARQGIDIKGVKFSVRSVRGRNARLEPYIQSIEVYQNPEFAKTVQAKAAILYGVDVKLSGDEIVAISVPGGLRKSKVKIRLSDYAKSCSNRILGSMSMSENELLILILDDKIKITRWTFEGLMRAPRVVLDLNEVTNRKTLDKAYYADDFNPKPGDLDLRIMDDQDRLDFYKGIGVLTKGLGIHSANFQVSSLFRFPEVVNQSLYEEYGQAFKTLSESELTWKWGRPSQMYLETFVSRGDVQLVTEQIAKGSLEYGFAKTKGHSIFWFLRTVTTLNTKMLTKFENYVQLFDPPSDVRKAYMRLCVRTIKWAAEWSTKKG